jgi:hypothetical protein
MFDEPLNTKTAVDAASIVIPTAPAVDSGTLDRPASTSLPSPVPVPATVPTSPVDAVTILAAKHNRELKEAIFGPEPAVVVPEPAPLRASNPLASRSLRGSAAEFEKRAADTKPLLGGICMAGQSTVLYAPPNAGKTLITLRLTIDAVTEGRLLADNTYYVNADDSSRGLAEKLRMMDDLGAHTLVPGFKGFVAPDLIGLLRRAADLDAAQGSLVIIDTLKKFTDLMDKKHSKEFADACRQYVMRGGTIVGLAHTTKSPNADGSLRFGGTTDILEDFDAAYVMTPLKAQADMGEKVVQFDLKKRRGDNPETLGFAYAAETGISYDERLSSVRRVDLTQLDAFRRVSQRVDDEIVIEAIRKRILAGGGEGKMALARAAGKACGATERAAIAVLERYTGTERGEHLWMFVTGERGVRRYGLLSKV